MKKTPLFYATYAIQFAVVFVAYYITARLSLEVGAVNTFAAPLWPPTGIALAALFFGGFRLAPAIVLAAFAVNYTAGAPLSAALGIALGNALEAIAAVYLLRNFRFNPLLGRLSDSFSLIVVALSAPLISAIIGPLALVAAGALHRGELPITSITWWIGDALGALVVAPFLFKWFARDILSSRRSFLQWLEVLSFFIALIVVAIIVFWQPISSLKDLSWPYLVFFPLTWGALRVGPRFVTAATIVVAAIATIGTVAGVGPFAGIPGVNDLFYLQLFLGTVAMIFLLFVATVEERKRSTRELERHVVDLTENVEEFSEADRAKNDFIAILSHELRNPLAPLVSSLELLRLNAGRIPPKDTIEIMYDQVGRITRLLDDLLDITRISKKKFNLQIERVSLQDILAHSITTTAESLRKRKHTFTSHIPKDTIWLDADPLRLEQVFMNVLNNSAKYTEPGGTISLTTVPTPAHVEVRIRDNGLGIPREMLNVIFEPFRQAHLHLEGSAGLGIGLSLSKRFVELHGGTIVAKSDGPGEGSEFIVTLPTAKLILLANNHGHDKLPPSQEPMHRWNLPKRRAASSDLGTIVLPASTSKSVLGKKKRSVLIVDDNEKAAEGIATLLNHVGHTARTAHNAGSAMKTLADFRPEIIFLDIGLPDGNGYDLAEKIRRYLSPVPLLVALTGYGQEEDKQRALDAGFDFHLTKPVSIGELEKILTRSI